MSDDKRLWPFGPKVTTLLAASAYAGALIALWWAVHR